MPALTWSKTYCITFCSDVEDDANGPVKGPINVMGGTRLGLEVNAKLNRKDFGLTYNKALETGGLMLGEEVAIQINGEFVKQADEKK